MSDRSNFQNLSVELYQCLSYGYFCEEHITQYVNANKIKTYLQQRSERESRIQVQVCLDIEKTKVHVVCFISSQQRADIYYIK